MSTFKISRLAKHIKKTEIYLFYEKIVQISPKFMLNNIDHILFNIKIDI